MATLVSLQLVRVAGVRDHHASAYTIPSRRSKLNFNKRIVQGLSLRTASQPREGSLQGGGSLCSPLWSHLLVSKRNSHVRAVRSPTSASSVQPIPYEQEIKKIAVNVANYSAILASYTAHLLKRTVDLYQLCPPLVAQVAPAMGLVAFSIWGLGPTTRLIRKNIFKRSDKKWDESRTFNIMASYMRPILLWIGIILICRAFDPVVLSTEASQIIKQRFVNFVRSLSTVLAFAFCTASLTQQVQRFMMEHQDAEESRNIGVQFIGNAVYTSVWIAAVCLFMELLGFSTQKWITAGGFGTVLITLAGREIFTNFLSSIMIHATRPFVDNEWIQTKIEGQEVSGTVEHVGWWSPTVIRGDDREAVHIPNHKFSVSVVRNLSQKTHWRIKTHLGISHLDVNKMTPIVADMRKVLAKHPQVEQQRLHRRVFFDSIDPENQALLILISCFVKTSHFEEYLRVKEIILLDLLKVISHHNARLATPIRSVQRVLDETESRSAGFRDMRSANQAQRRTFLLLGSQAVSASDDEEDDSDVSEDISEDLSQLSAQTVRATKAGPTKDSEDSGSESDGAVQEQRDLKAPNELNKHKGGVSEGDGNVGADSSKTPVAVQQIAKGSGSNESLQEPVLTENVEGTDVSETLMDRIHAGTEERLIKSHTDTSVPQNQSENGKATSEQPVAGNQVAAADVVVELPKEKVPHLYSNNVGLNDASEQGAETSSSIKSDSQGNKSDTPKINNNVHSDLADHGVGTAVQTGTDSTQGQTHTSKVIDKHGSAHVAMESTPSASSSDPWRQPSTSQTKEESSVSDGVMVGASTPQLSNESVPSLSPANTDDDPWKQPSASQTQNTHKAQPSSNLVVPGVAIDGPKHTLPLDDDILDNSRTLVALGKPSSIKERRDSSSHGVAKGATPNDTRERDR